MRKFIILAVAMALVGGAAYASFFARDNVPGSTLLVPYAVVGLTVGGTPDLNGYTTVLAVTNVSSAAQIIHVTVWNARSSTVVDFDEVLTGYDVWSINFRDLLNGRFDIFDTGVKPSDHTSAQPWGFWDDGTETPGAVQFGKAPLPWGPTSNSYTNTMPQPQDIDYAGLPYLTGCSNPPYGNLSNLSSTIISKIKSGIKAIPTGYVYCKGSSTTVGEPPWVANLTTNPLFFYATVDVVNLCSTTFPNQSGYWTGAVPKTANVLVGDIFYLNPTGNMSESIPAVTLESGPAIGVNSFYGRYTGAPGVDNREPLPTAWAFRYLNAGGITSELRLWKNRSEVDYADPTLGDSRYGLLTIDSYIAYACDPFLYYAWDEDENVRTRGGGPSGFATNEPNPLPFETQSVPLTSSNFNGLLDTNGWALLVFDTSVPSLQLVPYTGQLPFGWVGVMYNFGSYSTMNEGAVAGNYFLNGAVLPGLGITGAPTP
jgi:hypothetical protein